MVELKLLDTKPYVSVLIQMHELTNQYSRVLTDWINCNEVDNFELDAWLYFLYNLAQINSMIRPETIFIKEWNILQT